MQVITNGINGSNLFEKSNKNDEFISGEVVCINEKGLVKKVENENDLLSVIGICVDSKETGIIFNEGNKEGILVATFGLVFANTNDNEIKIGDLLVAEIDGTVKCKTALEDDLDIIGMAIKLPENKKVLMKIKT